MSIESVPQNALTQILSYFRDSNTNNKSLREILLMVKSVEASHDGYMRYSSGVWVVRSFAYTSKSIYHKVRAIANACNYWPNGMYKGVGNICIPGNFRVEKCLSEAEQKEANEVKAYRRSLVEQLLKAYSPKFMDAIKSIGYNPNSNCNQDPGAASGSVSNSNSDCNSDCDSDSEDEMEFDYRSDDESGITGGKNGKALIEYEFGFVKKILIDGLPVYDLGREFSLMGKNTHYTKCHNCGSLCKVDNKKKYADCNLCIAPDYIRHNGDGGVCIGDDILDGSTFGEHDWMKTEGLIYSDTCSQDSCITLHVGYNGKRFIIKITFYTVIIHVEGYMLPIYYKEFGKEEEYGFKWAKNFNGKLFEWLYNARHNIHRFADPRDPENITVVLGPDSKWEQKCRCCCYIIRPQYGDPRS